jgi:predicted permease
MLKDLRHAVRMLLHAKGWTAVVVLSLALGIGANTAIFSAVNSLLIVKVPVADPDSLVRFRHQGRNDVSTSSSDYGFLDRAGLPPNTPLRSTFSYPMYKQFVADNQTMTDVSAGAPGGRVNVVADGNADLASAFITSGNYYRMLGVRARLGRTILPEDDSPTAEPVAVISSRYWHARFATDDGIVGKVVQLNGVPVTIVGVLAPEFTGIQQPVGEWADVAFALSLDPRINSNPSDKGPPRMEQATYWWLQVMGRLKPGVTREQVQGNLEGVFQGTARANLEAYMSGLSDTERATDGNRNRKEIPRLLVQPGARGIYDVYTDDLRSVTILSIVVGLVLLIVCANVANLLLSRATARQKELSVRLSLGATRWRLVRQLLTESLLLAAMGGVLGIFLGYWGQQLLPGTPGRTAPLDWPLLAFVMGITCVTGILFGIAPALRGTGINLNSTLKETGRSVVGSRSLVGRVLLISQVAISLVLLIGAGLFIQSLENLRRVDVGFNPENLMLFRVNPSLNRYDQPRTLALFRDMLERLPTVPGVRGVAFSNPGLLSGAMSGTGIFVQGRAYTAGERQRDNGINRLVISPNFFEVMGIPLMSGRVFASQDTPTSPKVVIINEAAARKYFSNQNPLGQRFGTSLETPGEMEIVGVLRDAKYSSVREPVPPTMYVPYTQTRMSGVVFEVRTAAASATSVTSGIREAVRQLDSNLPVTDVSTQIEQVELRFRQEKLFAQAYSLFGGLALLIASVGLFGLMSYNVSRRTNEIGIRMALGAQRGDVLSLVMRESMILVGIGLVIGLGIALAAGQYLAARQYLETLLYGLSPTNVVAIVFAILLMTVVSAVAGYLPARRASRVDPMVALHYE